MSISVQPQLANSPGDGSTPAPKVAILFPGRATGGNAWPGLRYWEPLFDRLAERDTSVTIYANTTGQPPEQFRFRRLPSQFVRLGRRHNGYVPGISLVSPATIQDLRQQGFDLVICVEYNMSAIWAAMAAWGTRTKVAIFQENARHDSPLKRLLRRVLARFASVVIVNTDAARADVVDRLAVPADRVALIPLLMAPPAEFMCRQPVSLPAISHRPLFLCVAQLIPRKNVALLLAAADLLRRQGHEFTVWIVGTGPLLEELRAMRDDLGLDGTVEFLGAIPYPGMGFVYQACDVYVLPTHQDYRSVSVLEAMRFGKPILTSAGDGTAGEAVLHGANGYIFDPDSTHELAKYMDALIRDPDLRATMGARSAHISESQNAVTSACKIVRLIEDDPR